MTTDTRFVYRLTIPLSFPAGLAPGAGKDGGNVLALALDGAGDPVLRGTAIAGVLRHAWARKHGCNASPLGADNAVVNWFGYALGDDDAPDGNHQSLASPLRVADARLDTGKGGREPRHHNSIERHRGAVRDGGLFTLNALPPMTTTTVVLHLHVDEDTGALEFLRDLVGLVKTGLIFGGHGARGVGLAQIRGTARYRRFDLRNQDDCVAWLDESWAWRAGSQDALGSGEELVAPGATTDSLRVTLLLQVPRGQDICIGSGMGVEWPIEPQQVTLADGSQRWRIPGSSLRGCFRAWCNRLAARSALQGLCAPPADTVQRYMEHDQMPATGDEVGTLFHDEATFKTNTQMLAAPGAMLDRVVTCPVADLFGSLYNAGRLHIADAISTEPIDEKQSQHRRHVAVDRITGGASEGFLFDHAALMSGLHFKVEIVIAGPEELEARWMADTIRALDMGLIRVGSSKSAGRLALAAPPRASGPHADVFKCLQPSLGV